MHNIATEKEKWIYGDDVEIISHTKDCTVYRLANDTGNIVMTCYRVFPGIELIYNDVNIQSYIINRLDVGNVIEIDHCREGRIECEFRDEFFYLSQGDLILAQKSETGHGSFFPLSHYKGISIKIDLDKAPQCFSCFMDDVNVSPVALANNLCVGEKSFISRGEPCVEHIFSELYHVPESIKKGYFKVKILELLLFLSGMDPKKSDNKLCGISKNQVDLAKKVCQYMTKNMDDRITLDQLSARFHVSGTQIKNSFKAVYGVSIYSYVRTQKMQEAAYRLNTTDKSILEIAGEFGYDNGSKFAKAFRDCIGLSPTEYRQNGFKIV